MGIKDWFGLGDAVAKPINAVGDLYTTDKARIEAESKYEEIVQKPQLAQIENNKIFAISAIFFNSGWIPMLGWTAGFLILLFYAPQIVIATYVWAKNSIHTGQVSPFPMKPDDILNLIYLLFGLGGLGIAKKKIVG